AQDRRTDARAGARPGRHRSHRADGDPATGADHRRGFLADGRAAVAIRLALRARHHDHGRRSEEHTSELQSPCNLVSRLLLEKQKYDSYNIIPINAHLLKVPDPLSE